MEKINTNLIDCYILKPKRFNDNRGYFESVTKKDLEDLGFKDTYQVSNSFSQKGIIRGLHFQKDPYCQAKVVRCHQGKVLDVVVDIRKDSPTYGKYTAVELSRENGNMLYVPRGFAHGFVALEDDSLFEYYVDNIYMPKSEDGILYNDKDINIPWDEILAKYGITDIITSEKDKVRTPLSKSKVEFYRRPKRFLVTGYTGQLGYDIVRELRARGEYDILALGSDKMDITNKEQVFNVVKEYKPDVIFHCAAFTAVDKAEDMADDAYSVNVLGTKNLTNASLEVGAKIIYMSTDYVFDGTKEGIYLEDDKVNPKSVYGNTKYLGEEEVRNNPKHFIARISWVFGVNGNNFIKTMLKLSETKQKLTVVNDQIGSPTYTVDLARVLVEMAYNDNYGTYNLTNNGYCSWAEFADYIMKSNNLDTEIIPISTEEYIDMCQKKQAYRPRNSMLSKEKMLQNGYTLLPSWEDATDRYCEELKNSFDPQMRRILRRK